MPMTRVFRLFVSSTFSDFIVEREALQKLIQRRLATIKVFNDIRARKFANWLVGRRDQSSNPGSDNSFLSFGLLVTG